MVSVRALLLLSMLRLSQGTAIWNRENRTAALGGFVSGALGGAAVVAGWAGLAAALPAAIVTAPATVPLSALGIAALFAVNGAQDGEKAGQTFSDGFFAKADPRRTEQTADLLSSMMIKEAENPFQHKFNDDSLSPEQRFKEYELYHSNRKREESMTEQDRLTEETLQKAQKHLKEK